MRAHGSPPAAPRVCIECTLRRRAVRLPQGLEGRTLGSIAWRFSRCTRRARRLPSIANTLRGAFSKKSAVAIDGGRWGKSNGGMEKRQDQTGHSRPYRNFWIERETGSTRQPGAANCTLLRYRRRGVAGYSSLLNFDALSLNTLKLWAWIEFDYSIWYKSLHMRVDYYRFGDVFLPHAYSIFFEEDRRRESAACTLFTDTSCPMILSIVSRKFIFLTKYSCLLIFKNLLKRNKKR